MLALKDMGAKVFVGHKAENIDGADYIVFSSAVPENNVEMVEAKKRGLPIIERAEMLQYIFTLKKSIAISGTHGKTTTTSMITGILLDADCGPTSIIGAYFSRISGNSILGNSNIAVCEACEYLDSFLDLNSKK